ncbi:hypothetical protein LTS18_007994, partial [Coniosporium uncinatum]
SNPHKDEAPPNQKTVALHMWLLGYEFPTTLFVLTQDGLTVVTTKKKAALLLPLKGGKVPIEVMVRSKEAEQNAKQFEKCAEIIKNAGKKVGVFAKEKELSVGNVIEEWRKVMGDMSKDVEEVDITPALSVAGLAVKDEKELRTIRDASRASSGVLTNYFVEEMSSILDNEKKITHRNLANKVSEKIEDDKFFQKLKVSNKFDSMQLDWGFQPTVQSGGNYDLKFTSEPDENNLHAGVIVAALGLKYQSYGSLVARTYMVDPTKAQEANYKLLLAVHAEVLKSMRDGVPCRDVYNKAINLIKSKKPELEKNFVKIIGYGVGTENRDTTFSISAKNPRVLRDGMTFTITVGFSDLQNPNPQDKKSGTYSLVLADTVRVTSSSEATAVFTKDAPSDLDTVSFFFNDSEAEAPKPKSKKDSRIGAVAASNITSKRLRSDRAAVDNSEKEAERHKHQKELKDKMQEQGMERYGKGFGNLNGVEEKKFKKFESYKRDNQLPTRTKDLVILVDVKAHSIILPIMGRPVPFHINTVKNASTTVEGDFTSLRINFLSPGQGVGRKDDQPFEDPSAHFVRSLTFRSRDGGRMQDIVSQITDLKKEISRKEQEKKELEDVVEQEGLVLTKDRKPNNMDMVFLRPALDGKRVPGTMQIHQNGLRYVHGIGSAHVDILFSNIKHLFFQPCEKTEMIVLIHAHLINPIMIGKKTKDVQFYREATEMQFDETGNRQRRRRMGDEEEFEQEQEERKRRAELDRFFKNFALKIEDAADKSGNNLQVDIPVRELHFNGVHSRSSVTMQPTTDCLVQLTEPPFYVVSLSDIEVVHLER